LQAAKKLNKQLSIFHAKGGTEHPMELYKRFRGHEPSVQALLKRAGLV
jgi:Zn-dependent oligopeptidase